MKRSLLFATISILLQISFCRPMVYAQEKVLNVDSIINLGLQKYANLHYDSCLHYLEFALENIDSTHLTKDSNYYRIIEYKTSCLFNMMRYEDAVTFGEDAIKKTEGNVDIVGWRHWIGMLQELDEVYSFRGEYQNQIRILFKIIEEMERVNIYDTTKYVETLGKISNIFAMTNDKVSLDSINKKLFDCINTSFQVGLRNIPILSIIAKNSYVTDIFNAREIDMLIVRWAESNIHKYTFDSSLFRNYLFQGFGWPVFSYERLGKKEECVKYSRALFSKTCDYLLKATYIDEYAHGAMLYKFCFKAFFNNGYLGDAFDVLQHLAIALNALYDAGGLTKIQHEIGQLEYEYYRESSEYFKSINRPDLALSNDTNKVAWDLFLTNGYSTVRTCDDYMDIADDYFHLGDTDQYFSFMSYAAQCYRVCNGRKSIKFAESLIQISKKLILYSDTATAFYFWDTVQNIMSNYNIKKDYTCDRALFEMASYYMLINQYSLANDYLGVLISRGENGNVDKCDIWEKQMKCCIALNYQSGAVSILDSLYKRKKEIIKRGFANRPGNMRTNMWNEMGYLFTTYFPVTSYAINDSSSITIATNATIMSKSIVLNTEKNIRELIMHNNDKNVIDLYDTINFYLSMIDIVPDRSMAWNIEILKAEQQLSNIVKEYGDITRDLSIEWSDIQKTLKQNEAAIEFNSFTTDNDTTIYVAYVIRPQWSAPKQIVLKKLIKGEKLLTSNPYLNSNLSKTIWEKLSPVLNCTKTIYFAPAGELYNIAIESLPDYEDSTNLISDRYNLYRLSSTRELAKEKKEATIKNSNSFGGLRYDSKIDNSEQGIDKQRSFTYFPWSSDSIKFDKLPGYLPGSLAEVLYVDSIIGEASISSAIDTGINGTEAKFKSLSGSNTNLLLISTHGFYFNGIQEIKEARESIVGEDKSMTRSGLLFSGANNTFRNPRANTDTYNDGILTAQEIAQMDLKNVDLVVLSACETGLGELKGDGVFGLQRGFKKAGVNSIIMSLWEVDDLATKYLMTQFYENWLIKKMPKQKALKAAQDFVRNFEVEDDIKWAAYRKKNKADKGVAGGQKKTTQNGKKPETARDASKDNNVGHKGKRMKPFEDPDKWAAFILLDGLD